MIISAIRATCVINPFTSLGTNNDAHASGSARFYPGAAQRELTASPQPAFS